MLEDNRCPNKQNNLYKHPQKKYYDDSVNDSNSVKHASVLRNQILGISKLSDIGGYNDYSADSQFFDKSNILEQSLESELHVWKEQHKIDPQVVLRIEQQIRNIDIEISQLATQFEVCLNLQSKTQSYFLEFQQIMKGTIFTKLSRSNCKKTALRTLYYCPYLDALCWKSKSAKFPSSKQIIPIEQIVQIHTNYQRYKLCKKNFSLPKNVNEELFFAIETRNGTRLELIAENKKDHDLYIRTLNQLLSNSDKQFNSQFFIDQYSQNVNQIKKNLSNSKQSFLEAIEKLQQHFIVTTITLLKQEKEKTANIKKKSNHLINQNKQQIDQLCQKHLSFKKMIQDLQLEKDYFEQRALQLQEFYSARASQLKLSSNPQLAQINQFLKDLISLNGDNSIENESISDYKQTLLIDHNQDCIRNLKKVQEIIINSQNLEMNLRARVEKLQNENSQLQKIATKSQQELYESEELNQMLQKKLMEINLNMETKEQQFVTVIKEIQSLKQHLPAAISTNQSEISESNEKGHLSFFATIFSYICFLQVPEELENDLTQILQGLFVKISEKYGDFIQISFVIQQIKRSYYQFESQNKIKLESQIKDQLNCYVRYLQNVNKKSMHSPTSTQNSKIVLEKTFSSPNKLFVKNNAKFFRKDTNSSLDPQQIKYLSQLVR